MSNFAYDGVLWYTFVMLLYPTRKIIEQMQIGTPAGMIPFKLWPRQLELLELLHARRKIIIIKKRQVGCSQLVGADSIAQEMISENFTTLVLSKSGDDAVEFLRRAKEMQLSLPQDLRKIMPVRRDTAETLEFKNNSRILSVSSNRGAGYTAQRVVIDEAAFITKADSGIDLKDVLRRVEPTLDKTGGQLVLISTANGFNLFRDLVYDALSGKNSFSVFFFSCWDDPTFSEAKRETIVQDFGVDHACQEYPRSIGEAFLASGRPRFDLASIEKLPLVKTKDCYELNILDDGISQDFNAAGEFLQFTPPKPLSQYLITADVAEGTQSGDYSVAKGYDRITQEPAFEYRSHIEPVLFGKHILPWLGTLYNNAIIAPEANNHGLTSIAALLATGYPESLVFEHDFTGKEKADDDFNRGTPRFGWRTTSTTRPLIINHFANKVLSGGVILTENDLSEARSFVIKNGKAQAESRCHDDCIIAACIAHYLLDNESFNTFYPIAELSLSSTPCSLCQYISESSDSGFNCQRTGRYIPLASQFSCGLFEPQTEDFGINEPFGIDYIPGCDSDYYY